MTREVFLWIVNASIISPIIPLICLWIFRMGQPRQNRILAISLCISFVFDVTAWAVAQYKVSNSVIINLYFIVAFPAIMWFYHETLIKPILKLLVRIFCTLFLVLALALALLNGIHSPDYTIWMTSSILITLTSLFFVVDLNLMDASNFLNNPFHKTNILINTSLALYYFVTTVMFAVSDYVFAHATREGGFAFWACHNGLNILKNIGVAVAFYRSAKISRSFTHPRNAEHPSSVRSQADKK